MKILFERKRNIVSPIIINYFYIITILAFQVMPHSVFPETDRDNSKIKTKKMENGKNIPHPGQGGLNLVLLKIFAIFLFV